GLLVLVIWPSKSVSANCPSSWYWSRDTDNLYLCGEQSDYMFQKFSHWYVHWYCDPDGYHEVIPDSLGTCGCAGGACWPVFETPYIETTGQYKGFWVQRTRVAHFGSPCGYDPRVPNVAEPPAC